jgi:hypothetical protein
MEKLRAGTGSSRAADAVAAGREAARTALAALADEPPALVIVYTSVRYPTAELVAAVRSLTGDTPVVGATTSGQFHDGEILPPGEGVVVVALTAGSYRFGVASVEGIAADPHASGVALARTARDAAGPQAAEHSTVLLLTGGMSVDAQELINGIFKIGGARVPVVGGAGGDDKRLQATSAIHNDRIMDDGAVAVWIVSDHPLGVTVGHGWYPITDPLMVTSSDGHVVHELGGRPAAEVYSEAVNAHAYADREEGWAGGTWHAAHGLGLIEPDGSHVVRGAMKDQNDVLTTFVPLPPYAAVQVVTSTPDSLIEIVDRLVPQAVESHDVGIVLGFSCISRLDVLADRGAEEAKRFQAAAGNVPTAGFYTYGEYARTLGVTGVHNATLAVLAL